MAKDNEKPTTPERVPVVHFIGPEEQVILKPAPHVRDRIEDGLRLLRGYGVRLSGMLPRLRRGPKPKYDHAAITAVAEEVIREHVPPTLTEFAFDVSDRLEARGVPVPGDTVLREICARVFKTVR
jgi:hypothetical protein